MQSTRRQSWVDVGSNPASPAATPVTDRTGVGSNPIRAPKNHRQMMAFMSAVVDRKDSRL